MSSYSIDLKELLEAGCHFGHQARRWNPKMAPYIYTTRDGVSIFDLAITAERLADAMEYVKDLVKEGKVIVFVGTKRQAQDIVREEATKVGAPFIAVRWLGGTLTNWEEISKRIRRFLDMKDKREKGEYKAYTKKEQVLIDKEISKLERFLGGIAHLTKTPDALFVVDTHKESVVMHEAFVRGVPVVGMVDSNADPDNIFKVIPANDDAIRSVKLIVAKIAEAYADGAALFKKGADKVEAKASYDKK
ncbi:30S ribosomal protein S2 [Microgenomates group bacterium RIFCSPLOWO2_01_FULL_47_10]|nr:MAG: 30S ribosomal protein S2 [Microgenomates group bacterium RIFCSPLOWO2_01_FULL_47_10]